eukprot:RCo033755
MESKWETSQHDDLAAESGRSRSSEPPRKESTYDASLDLTEGRTEEATVSLELGRGSAAGSGGGAEKHISPFLSGGDDTDEGSGLSADEAFLPALRNLQRQQKVQQKQRDDLGRLQAEDGHGHPAHLKDEASTAEGQARHSDGALEPSPQHTGSGPASSSADVTAPPPKTEPFQTAQRRKKGKQTVSPSGGPKADSKAPKGSSKAAKPAATEEAPPKKTVSRHRYAKRPASAFQEFQVLQQSRNLLLVSPSPAAAATPVSASASASPAARGFPSSSAAQGGIPPQPPLSPEEEQALRAQMEQVRHQNAAIYAQS